VEERYGITAETPTENSFYFHVVSKCLILHGYGEPLLDKFIIDRVKECTKRNIPTYFSCVPANINIPRIKSLMENGLSVIKFSVDALDDDTQKKIRGKHNDFTKSFAKIQEVIALKEEHGFDTKVVVTMIALGTANDDLETQHRFMDIFDPMDVFNYVKSQDNRWYFERNEDLQNQSHYVSQYCEFPWTSMTVMANGEIVPCTQDYDAEMSFGNVRDKDLKEVWNSKEYHDFRRSHLTGEFPKGCKCNERCDLPKVYHRLQQLQQPVKGGLEPEPNRGHPRLKTIPSQGAGGPTLPGQPATG
jgi:radical SAM protein with 4Fe4S-binding SPASM domain